MSLPLQPLADLEAVDDAFLTGLAARLRDAAYDEATFAPLRTLAAGALAPARRPLIRRHLEARSDAPAVLALLFAYGGGVDPEAVAQILGAELVETALAVGLLRQADGSVAANLRLVPFDDLVVLSDEPHQLGDPVVGPAGRELSRALPHSLGGLDVLDVGCGSGALTLVAARRGASAVGTDIAPRAVALARLNARLNGVTGATFLEGDLFEPVAGRAFDLVLSHPPFQVRPLNSDPRTSLHGGERGEELGLRLVAGLAPHLRPGGRALLRMDFPQGAGFADIGRRILGALDPPYPVRGLLARAGRTTAERLAMVGAAATVERLDARYDREARALQAHLDTQGIDGVVHALVDLRRVDPGTSRLLATVGFKGFEGLDGFQLDRSFDAVAAAAEDDATLSQLRLRTPEGAEVRMQRLVNGSGPSSIVLTFPGRPVRDHPLDEEKLVLLEAVTTTMSPARALHALAAMGGDPEVLAPRVLKLVRQLLLSSALMVKGRSPRARESPALEKPDR
jgi:SAM-dependent methyltransferase